VGAGIYGMVMVMFGFKGRGSGGLISTYVDEQTGRQADDVQIQRNLSHGFGYTHREREMVTVNA
jgi:hypothetical protein